MKALPYILLLGALAWFIPKGCANDARWKDWSADTTRLLLSVDGLQSQKRILERENDSLQTIANRLSGDAKRGRRVSDSLRGVATGLRGLLDSATNAPDSADVAIRLVETLQGSLDTLQGAFDRLAVSYEAQKQAIGNLERVDAFQSAAIDSLVSLIRRTPGRCKVLGLINCPVVVGGYGLTVKGPQAFVGVGIPLR